MLRLCIYQETAHFRIPTIGMPVLSYPLPPPSTVFGFLRAITNYKSINYHNTRLSIQGIAEGYSFEKEYLDLTTLTESKKNIITLQKFYGCSWVIHIESEFEDDILDAVDNSSRIFRLGRSEDLIISIDITQIPEIYSYDSRNSGNDTAAGSFENKIDPDNLFIYKRYRFDNVSKQNIPKGIMFRMALDTRVDDQKKIIGYEPIQVLYVPTKILPLSDDQGELQKEKFYTDGKFIISWLSEIPGP